MNDPLDRPIRPLLGAQFLGVFNDNAFKSIVTFLAIGFATTGLEGTAAETEAQFQTTVALVVFLVPALLVSIPAGALADRLSKRSVLVGMKALEVGLMAVGTIALALDPTSTLVPLLVLGLMGLRGGVFAPAKYGIVPEVVPHSRLSACTGSLEMWTFFAIVIGGAAGAGLKQLFAGTPWVGCAALTVLAATGWHVSRGLAPVPAASTGVPFVRGVAQAWRDVRGDRTLWLSILGAAFFWAIASLLGQNVLVYARVSLAQDELFAALPLAVFGVGVGAGSVWAGRLSGEKVETGLLPLGAAGLAAATLAFGLLTPGIEGTYALMGAMGVASGFLVVPLNALQQWRAPAERRGGVLALSNLFTTAGMIAGSVGSYALAEAGLDPAAIFIPAAIATILGTWWALWLLPSAFLRLVLVLMTHTVYRLRVEGRDRVPTEGAALLTPNHVSFVDGLFLIAAVDRPVRFIVDRGQYERPVVNRVLKWLGAIPIASEGGPREVMRALKDAGAYLDQGEVVCIFPEGQITRTGMLNPFRRGVARIAKGRDCVIVPVNLDRVWGSIFSRQGGRFLFKRPRRLPYPVTVAFGEPLPPDTPVAAIREAVQRLGAEAWMLRERSRPPLHRAAIRAMRQRPGRLCYADATRPKVTCLQALAGAIALGRAMREHWKGQERVGILLPPSVGGALVNLAAAFAGRASVNLNYTAGRAALESAALQAGLRTVVTSRSFLEKAQVELPQGPEPVWIEEIGKGIGGGARFCALLTALFAPVWWIERACGAERAPRASDEVTVIFSSGSTGEPKGVRLSHFNIDSNVEALGQVFLVQGDDRLLGILPLFHSFGTMALWFSTIHGIATVFHPNPLDPGAVGDLVGRYRVTMVLATPTFLQLYLRRCTPEQFGSVRIVIAGAEKLPEPLCQAFDDTFGIRPMEGYGATECSPVIAVSVPDFRAAGLYQPGWRRGFVGQPLPGMALRITDPETGADLPPGQAGMLHVRGPNVMMGYLGRDDLTAKALVDGWYVTGDVAMVDEDGFLKITDRLSRFSKIGGEMVPHGRVEEALHRAAGADHQVFAVTAVPDERKGERLAVLHTLDPDRIPEVREKLTQEGLPNLFIPRADDFIRVDEIPILGTGKLDLRAVKEHARSVLA